MRYCQAGQKKKGNMKWSTNCYDGRRDNAVCKVDIKEETVYELEHIVIENISTKKDLALIKQDVWVEWTTISEVYGKKKCYCEEGDCSKLMRMLQ